MWLTAGEAADAAHVTHSQVADWVSESVLSARMGWRGGAQIQLVLLSDLEALASRVDLDRVRGSLAERGVFTGPRRVVLGGFKAETPSSESQGPSGAGSEAQGASQSASQGSGAAVIRAAHEIRAEDRVWASELDGEVRRLRQVIRTIRADHESLERHLEKTVVPSGSADENVGVSAEPAAAASVSEGSEGRSGVTSGAMLAVACGVVLGMVGAAFFIPGAKTLASEKSFTRDAVAKSLAEETASMESAAPSLAPVVTEADARSAVLALDTMELEAGDLEAGDLEAGDLEARDLEAGDLSDMDVAATDDVQAPGATDVPQAVGRPAAAIHTASFTGAHTGSRAFSAPSATGQFFEHFLTGSAASAPSGVTGTSGTNAIRTASVTQVMGPELPPDMQPDPELPLGKPVPIAVPVEASARIPGRGDQVPAEVEMLIEPPPLKPRARGVKPNALGAPKRLRVPMSLAELDRTLFARRSALLSDCAYTDYVTAPTAENDLSAALVLGPCFGPTREGQEGLVAAPGTHRVGNVACCRHHAFVERMTAAALDEAARLGLKSEAKAALREGVLPPLFRLRATRAATRFLREETRGWTSAGLDGVAGASSAEETHHEWKLSDQQDVEGAIRVQLASWIQPIVPFDAKPGGASSSRNSLRRFQMTLLVQAAPDGDVLERFEWIIESSD